MNIVDRQIFFSLIEYIFDETFAMLFKFLVLWYYRTI
jgi:hypothetical protein